MTNEPDAEENPGESAGDLWTEVRTDVESLFGDDVDVTAREYGDYVDVRVLPSGAVEKLEDEHDDLRVAPYNACQMTIRKEE